MKKYEELAPGKAHPRAKEPAGAAEEGVTGAGAAQEMPNTEAAATAKSETSFAPSEAAAEIADQLEDNESLAKKFFASPLARFALIGVLSLLLLIPLGFVQRIIYEREDLYQSATSNISASWGGQQTINGPVLIIPYQVWHDDKRTVTVKVKGKEETRDVVERIYITRFKVVLPASVYFNADLESEVRYRGIYRQVLYTAPVNIDGIFTLPKADEFAVSNLHKIYWNEAWLAVGITDLMAIIEESPAQWGNEILGAYEPGADAKDLLGPGFHVAVPLAEDSAGQSQTFAMRLKIRGSGGIFFTPVGKDSVITIAGSWPDPSFQGNLLPVERSITGKGFSARWNIPNLTRTYPQLGDLSGAEFKSIYGEDDGAIKGFTAGVNLQETVSLYRMSMRAADYGILFIAMTFTALFAFEMAVRRRMHLLQYGMVGLSMSLFYLILLSMAEHVDFGLAFTAAGAVTVGMNSLYLGAALRSKFKGLLMGSLLTGLYGLLFSLLRMEDFALLVGTGLVVTMMGVLMFVTRKLPPATIKNSTAKA